MADDTATQPTPSTPTDATASKLHAYEMWAGKLLAGLLSALYLTGVIPTDGAWAKVAGVASAVLLYFGFAVLRTKATAALTVVLLLALGATQPACSWFKHEGTVAKGAALDCTKKQFAPAIAAYAPLLGTAIRLATGGDGKVDWSQVDDATKGMLADDGACVIAEVTGDLLHQLAPEPGAPKSAELEVNAKDVALHFEVLRKTRYGGRAFTTSHGPL